MDELVLLRQSVRDALESQRDRRHDEGPRSWSTTWNSLAAQGLWSASEPPEGSLAAAAVIAEELGRALFAGPGPEALAAQYVLSHLDEADRPPETMTDGPTAVLVGSLGPTVEVDPQTALVVCAPDGEIAVVSADSAVSTTAPSLDVNRNIVTLSLETVPLTGVHGRDSDLCSRGMAARTLLYCADTLGCIDSVMEKAVDYANQRTTFGAPIGKYQAVAHRLVDHTITAQQIRLLLCAAVMAFDDRSDNLARHVAIVESFIDERATALVSDCVQLAGAIGFTWEFEYHLYLRRVLQNRALGRARDRPQQSIADHPVVVDPDPEKAQFRCGVKEFIARRAPSGMWCDGVRVPPDAATEHAVRQWYSDLFSAGLLGGSWPTRYGGRLDHAPWQDAVVMEEIVRARAPRPIDQVLLAAHLIITFGTEAQRGEYLPRIRDGRDIWCQLFSEPGVGSDLARLSTRATPLPDGGFRVHGQKVWTTDGQWSQMGVLVARTDPTARPHAGLTVFVVDMASPGIDVRPIREMTGSAEFCEVYLDGVILPPDSVLGELNGGWGVVNSGLASERAYVGANSVMLELLFDDLAELAGQLELGKGIRAIEDPSVRHALADFSTRIAGVQSLARNTVDHLSAGIDSPTDGMIAKLTYTELNVEICLYAVNLAARGLLAPAGEAVHARWLQAFLWSRALTISGGSSEIIRNVLAVQLLGLPRSW
jgi:alkylation response protein AidB-like acyl-CoA dehydrogenase